MSAGCAGFIKIIYGHMLSIRTRSLRTPISSLPAPPSFGSPRAPHPLQASRSSAPSLEHFPISELLAGEPGPSQAMHMKYIPPAQQPWCGWGWAGREGGGVRTRVCIWVCTCACVHVCREGEGKRKGKGKGKGRGRERERGREKGKGKGLVR